MNYILELHHLLFVCFLYISPNNYIVIGGGITSISAGSTTPSINILYFVGMGHRCEYIMGIRLEEM